MTLDSATLALAKLRHEKALVDVEVVALRQKLTDTQLAAATAEVRAQHLDELVCFFFGSRQM